MSSRRTSIDREALPDELLDVAKTQMRVEFSRDDDYIKLCIARAIDFFERLTEMSVNPVTFDWVPVSGINIDGVPAYVLNWQPAPSFTAVTNDADKTDVTDQYAIFGDDNPDVYGIRWISPVAEPWPSATPLFEITAGYASADDLPPGILSFILEAASWYYEYREASAMPGVDGVPYLNQLLTAYWVPRA